MSETGRADAPLEAVAAEELCADTGREDTTRLSALLAESLASGPNDASESA